MDDDGTMPNRSLKRSPVWTARQVMRGAAVLAAVIGLGLTLGACSKCDVPVWQPRPAGPQSCHDGPSQ